MAGVTVDFNANLARFEDGIRRANAHLDGFRDTAERISGGVSKALGVLGVGISVAGMTSLVKATVDEADALDELAAKTGITVEKLSGLVKIPDLAGKSFDQIAAPFARLSKEIATNADELAALGITARDPLEAFEQLADVFNGIEDPMQRAAVMNKILGKSWQELAPLLANGGKAIDEMINSAQAAAGVTAELAAESAEFNDRLSILETNLQGVRNKAIGPLIPVLNDLANFFQDSADSTDTVNDKVSILSETYKVGAESVAVFATGVEIAGKGVVALAAKLGALLSFDFDQFDVIDQAFQEDIARANEHLNEFFRKVEGVNPDVNIDVTATDQGGNAKTAVNQKIQEYLDGAEDGKKAVTGAMREMNAELDRHLKGIERNIDDEVSLYKFRNDQLEVANDLGLVSQEDYFTKKQQLQKDQLAETQALLDQEINALKQFQSQATDDATRTDTQDKINDLIRQKTELERQGQIATLENAAAASKALGEYAGNLVDINNLLAGVTSSIIGMSQAQAEVNFKTPGTGPVTAADLADPNTIFRSADGTSFSDRPTQVGVELDLPENEILAVQGQLEQFKTQAVADSAILLGVTVDQAAALAGVDNATSAINQKLSELKPMSLGIDVDQAIVVEAAKRARDAAQAAVQPIVIPVFYQQQTAPAAAPTPAASNNSTAADLAQTALAQGGR